MTDRQPGAPGQYTLSIDAGELQKLLAGTNCTVVLTRNDQPVVEGTPYNKASVLPDDLAAQICPSVTDPTPADALRGLSKQKFSATLKKSAWTETNGVYTQRVAVTAVQGDDNESVKSWPVFSGTKATDEAILDACAAVSYAKTSTGSVNFVCLSDKPDADIPLIVEVSR